MAAAWLMKPCICDVYAFAGDSMLKALQACATVRVPSKADGILELEEGPRHLHGTLQMLCYSSNSACLL